jgi:thiamine kinase-like enzyme
VEIALTDRALRFALQRGHLSGRWRLVLALLEWMPFGPALLTRLLPGVGFAAFRPGTKPFAWIADRLIEEADVDIALVTNWRGERAPYLVFGIGAAQTLVAKRGEADCTAQIRHETAMLEKLAAGLANCGLEVPRLIHGQTSATLSTLIESDVPGRPMMTLIREGHHNDLGRIAGSLAEWLERWNRQTIRHVELTPELAERLIFSAARAVAGSIDCGSAYLDWLSRQIARITGTKVPLVAAHNDLTMANVLGDVDGVRSVVDWEAASLDGLPLADFRYAACDAASAIHGGNRLAAFRTCFLVEGDTRRRLQRSEAPLLATAGGPPKWLELCTHAAWLGHAANEQARSSSSHLDGSFVAIANALAERVA